MQSFTVSPCLISWTAFRLTALMVAQKLESLDYQKTVWAFNMSGSMFDPYTTATSMPFLAEVGLLREGKGSSSIWDPRAKLLLYIDMKNDAGEIVATECRDLSSDTATIFKGQYTLELTRKCVNYDFRLVMKRGTSPLHFHETDADSLVLKLEKQEKGDDAVYKFMNNDQHVNLAAKQQQSSVELTWKNTGGDRDFYRVLRREHLCLRQPALGYTGHKVLPNCSM